MQPFLHLICLTPCDYKTEPIKSAKLCGIATTCIERLYSPLNERNKERMSNLMCACKVLHIPLIETLLRFGPDLEAKDVNGHDVRWYVEHCDVVCDDAEQIAQRKQQAFELLDRCNERSDDELEFIDFYEEKYDDFVLNK